MRELCLIKMYHIVSALYLPFVIIFPDRVSKKKKVKLVKSISVSSAVTVLSRLQLDIYLAEIASLPECTASTDPAQLISYSL